MLAACSRGTNSASSCLCRPRLPRPAFGPRGTRVLGRAECSFRRMCGVQGRVFVDRDPRWFRLVLNFLRDGGCELPESSVDRRELTREADYYQARPRKANALICSGGRASIASTGRS